MFYFFNKCSYILNQRSTRIYFIIQIIKKKERERKKGEKPSSIIENWDFIFVRAEKTNKRWKMQAVSNYRFNIR